MIGIAASMSLSASFQSLLQRLEPGELAPFSFRTLCHTHLSIARSTLAKIMAMLMRMLQTGHRLKETWETSKQESTSQHAATTRKQINLITLQAGSSSLDGSMATFIQCCWLKMASILSGWGFSVRFYAESVALGCTPHITFLLY